MKNTMLDDISEVFFSEKQLEEIVAEIGKKISRDYADKKLLLLCVLKGSIMFMSDLMKHITIPCSIDFVTAKSYGSSMETSGKVDVPDEKELKVEGFDVVVVEDILDSGRTLKKIIDVLKNKKAASVSICTLLDKPERRQVEIEAKYIGAEVQNQFVVGYGLDFNQRYRNLPFIGVLKSEAAERIKQETDN